MAAILDISGLTKVFPARHGRALVHALKHINLTLDEGDFLAVMGPSGCGKSTLLNIVAGFDQQDEGTCLVRDRPVTGPGPDRGMVFQEYALFPWMTVERNLVFAMRAAGKYNAGAPARIQATLERMGLWQFRLSYPKHLSGGMRQRLAIARILAIDSPMMLMDEPFGALDALTRGVLQGSLVELWQETRKTILFITHSVDEALFLAERVIVMAPRPGTIVLDRRIDLKRPRDVTTPEFNDLKREILTMISPTLHDPDLRAPSLDAASLHPDEFGHMKTVAIDIGGTFTDLAALDPETGALSFAKCLTTPPNFEQGALDCIAQAAIPGTDIEVLRHGTTVVINALLERKGARTALVTTEGFRDILEIGRGNRPESFNLFYHRMEPLVPRALRFEVAERLDARGGVLRELDDAALPVLVEKLRESGVEAVAICLLHAWRNPVHEQRIAAYLRAHLNCFVSASHEISREFREYERTSTAVLNAYVGPSTAHYLARFGDSLRQEGFSGNLYLMGSNGGVLTEDETRVRPLLLVESGPVGGAAGAAEIGAQLGLKHLVAFDMGGTTAKAVLIEDGEAVVSPLYWVGGYDRGYPVQAAVLDIVEVGAGGGSIAGVNELGALQVGPRSAGAAPGPACYGRGGTEPTVTDANLWLGRLDGDRFLGGTMKLDTGLADAALGGLADRLDQRTEWLAAGILEITTLTMATAVRRVTIERGFDPRDFAMVAFGGAGPLHAVAVAREIGMKRVIIPPMPGHFSAYGMLYADFRYDVVDTVAALLERLDLDEVEGRFVALEKEGAAALDRLGLQVRNLRTVRYAEMRYQRQEYTIKVRLPAHHASHAEWRALFEEQYARRYGHVSREMPIDVLMLRVVADGQTTRPTAGAGLLQATGKREPRRRDVWFAATGRAACDVWQRDELPAGTRIAGPAVIEEHASTTVLPPGDRAEIDQWGNIVIDLGDGA